MIRCAILLVLYLIGFSGFSQTTTSRIQLVYAKGEVSHRSITNEYKGLLPGHLFNDKSTLVVGEKSEALLIINNRTTVEISKPGQYGIKDIKLSKDVVVREVPASVFKYADYFFYELHKRATEGERDDIKKYKLMELTGSVERCCTFSFYGSAGQNRILNPEKTFIRWGKGDCNKYKLAIENMFGEQLQVLDLDACFYETQLSLLEDDYVVRVSSLEGSCSGSFWIKVQFEERESLLKKQAELISALDNQNWIFRNLVLTTFYIENRLALDGIYVFEHLAQEYPGIGIDIYYGMFQENLRIANVVRNAK